nr:hypothetical protein MarQu_155 [Marseillevirus sp.]
MEQPGFPFKGFELRLEGKKFSEEAFFPTLSKLEVVLPNSKKYFIEQVSPMTELNLEDLPDEVLLMIAENSPGPSFGLANKRLAGIWNEANNLRRLILKKDKKAGNPKFSDRFGKDEIEPLSQHGVFVSSRKELLRRLDEKKHGIPLSIFCSLWEGSRKKTRTSTNKTHHNKKLPNKFQNSGYG